MNTNQVLLEKYQSVCESEATSYVMPPYFKNTADVDASFVLTSTFIDYYGALFKSLPNYEAFSTWLFKNNVPDTIKVHAPSFVVHGLAYCIGRFLSELFLNKYQRTSTITGIVQGADNNALKQSSDVVKKYVSDAYKYFCNYYNALNANNPGIAGDY